MSLLLFLRPRFGAIPVIASYPAPVANKPRKRKLSKKEKERILLRLERERREEENFLVLLMKIMGD